MNIGIDGNEANVEQRVGVNTYAFEILWGLYKLQDNESKKRANFTIYLKHPPRSDLPKEEVFWKYKQLPPQKFWVATQLMPHLYKTKSKPDIFFAPSHYLPPFCPMPAVCSIMDLGYLEFSDQFKAKDYWQLKLWSARSMHVANKIFSISNTTKNEIVRHYVFARNKVVVTPLGYDKSTYNLTRPQQDVRRVISKYNLSNNYILFLSTLKPSKNVVGLLESWAEIQEKFPDTKLVIAGKKGWLFEDIFKSVKNLDLEERVIFTDYVPEKDKEALIKGARVFTLPSFWEGFGLDVVSSMASGVPVIVSDRGSLPEVVGKAGIIIDPDKTNDLSMALQKVLNMSSSSYNNLSKLGLQEAKKFSWEKAATITLSVLEEM